MISCLESDEGSTSATVRPAGRVVEGVDISGGGIVVDWVGINGRGKVGLDT